MNDVTLKIDADTASYIAKIAKMAEAHEGVNEKLKDHGKFADHLTHGLERSLFRAIAIKDVAVQISDALARAAEKSAQINAKGEDHRERIATSLTTLGFKGQELSGAMSAAEQLGGMATETQRDSFIGRLSQEQERRQKAHLPLITPKQTFEALNAYRQGGDIAYGEGGEHLLNLFTNPQLGYGIGANVLERANDIAADRLGQPNGPGALQAGLRNLPRDLQREARVRAGLMYNEQKAREAAELHGAAARLGQSYQDVTDITSPFSSAFEKIAGAASAGVTHHFFQNILEAQQTAIHLSGRKVLRQDNPHDEGKP